MKKPSFQKRTHQVFSQDRYVYQLRINLIMTKKEIRFLYTYKYTKNISKKEIIPTFFLPYPRIFETFQNQCNHNCISWLLMLLFHFP